MNHAITRILHRQVAADSALKETQIRAELVERVRTAIHDVDDWNGRGDLFTHMAEASVDAFVAFYQEKRYRPPT